MKGNKLFWQRFRRTQRTNVKYFRLLFNDHFVLFLVILFGAFVLGYRELLNTSYPIMFWRSNWWQVVIIIWLLIGLHIGDLLTYFRPADRLYLLGNDSDIIKKYLSSAIRISIIYASIWQLIFIVVVVPLLLRIYVSSMARVVAIVVFIITYKLILLLYERDKLFLKQRRQTIKVFEPNSMAEKLLFQILVPSIFLELILTLTSSPIYILVVAWSVLTVVAYRYFYINRFKANSFAMNWNSAIQQAQNQQQHVLHFFSMFAEIPNQPKIIKRRFYLDIFLYRLIKSKPAMLKLYWTRLARDTEILPLITRLIIIGMIIIGVLKSAPDWLIIGIAIIIVYLVNFQLLPLFSDTQKKLWTRLMPIPNSNKQQMFIRLHRTMNYFVCTLCIITVAVTNFSMQRIILLLIVLSVVVIGLQKSYIPYMIKKIKK